MFIYHLYYLNALQMLCPEIPQILQSGGTLKTILLTLATATVRPNASSECGAGGRPAAPTPWDTDCRPFLGNGVQFVTLFSFEEAHSQAMLPKT